MTSRSRLRQGSREMQCRGNLVLIAIITEVKVSRSLMKYIHSSVIVTKPSRKKKKELICNQIRTQETKFTERDWADSVNTCNKGEQLCV